MKVSHQQSCKSPVLGQRLDQLDVRPDIVLRSLSQRRLAGPDPRDLNRTARIGSIGDKGRYGTKSVGAREHRFDER